MQFLVVLVLSSFLGTIACASGKSNPDVVEQSGICLGEVLDLSALSLGQ
jgi:hypothetical protein